MLLTARRLNRTLLHRQHLLARAHVDPLEMTEHLLGLQAQDPLPPYLALAARVEDFDPHAISATLESRTTVRLLLMRGTIHLVTGEDALALRPYVQPMLDKVTRNSAASKQAADLDRSVLHDAGREVLRDGPLSLKALGERLAARFPGYPAPALANSLREITPLVQVPPRGLWNRSGGVVYDLLGNWLGAALPTDADPRDVARRYLRAFGPATPADLTAWSGATGSRAVLHALGDELVQHEDERGRRLYDLAALPLADEDTPAPVRLLGKYDNLWLSHADRDRVTPEPEKRRRWMGANGGAGNTVFVDGTLHGLWRLTENGRVDLELFRELTSTESVQLDEEVGRVESLLARQ